MLVPWGTLLVILEGVVGRLDFSLFFRDSLGARLLLANILAVKYKL